jgi:hypothetical protein
MLSFSFAEFSFQDQENARIQIAPDRTIPDLEDPDHEDKMPKNTRTGFAAGKTSSQHSIQDWSDDDSDGDCRMFLDPTHLAYAIPTSPITYAFPAAPSPGLADEDVVDATPLNQGPPPSTRAGKKNARSSLIQNPL